jgi:hypothetical protein
LVARRAALTVLSEQNCFPFVGDLATVADLQHLLATRHPPARTKPLRRGESPSLITFFGMIPNFEPRDILPKLASLLRPKDFLLFSANLAPGRNYVAGMKKVLPQYDNVPTRDWLMTFLLDLGIEKRDGRLRFLIENGDFSLKRMAARFHFLRTRQIEIEGEVFNFKAGEAIQLFFSYRYTPELASKILEQNGLRVLEQWIAASEEEGVFLCSIR